MTDPYEAIESWLASRAQGVAKQTSSPKEFELEKAAIITHGFLRLNPPLRFTMANMASLTKNSGPIPTSTHLGFYHQAMTDMNNADMQSRLGMLRQMVVHAQAKADGAHADPDLVLRDVCRGDANNPEHLEITLNRLCCPVPYQCPASVRSMSAQALKGAIWQRIA